MAGPTLQDWLRGIGRTKNSIWSTRLEFGKDSNIARDMSLFHLFLVSLSSRVICPSAMCASRKDPNPPQGNSLESLREWARHPRSQNFQAKCEAKLNFPIVYKQMPY